MILQHKMWVVGGGGDPMCITVLGACVQPI